MSLHYTCLTLFPSNASSKWNYRKETHHMGERGGDPALARHEDAIQDILSNGALRVPALTRVFNDHGAYFFIDMFILVQLIRFVLLIGLLLFDLY